MRGMLRFVGLLGIIVGVLTALALGVLSLQINIVAGKALPEPQSLRLAELVKEGAGENIHVALSDFTAGKPVIIEEKDGGWKAVWVPLYPGPRVRNGTPPTF